MEAESPMVEVLLCRDMAIADVLFWRDMAEGVDAMADEGMPW